jgi:hypothetical protein
MTAEGANPIAEIEARSLMRNKRQAVEHEVSRLGAYYAETGNPLCVWAIIRYCDDKGVDLPGWARDYLSKSAVAIMEIATGPAKTAPDRCLEALGLRLPRGKESPFEEYRRWTLREPACVEFARLICAGTVYKNARLDAAGKFGVSPTTLDVWLRDFFPGRGQGERWSEFLKQVLDLEGPRFSPTLSSAMGGAFFLRAASPTETPRTPV